MTVKSLPNWQERVSDHQGHLLAIRITTTWGFPQFRLSLKVTLVGFGGFRVLWGNDMLVRDRIPNYTSVENKQALATLTTELVPEASLMRESLVWVPDRISEAVFLTVEAMWHITADANIGLCKTNSGPSPEDLNQWFAVSPRRGTSTAPWGTCTAVGKTTAISGRIPQQPPDFREGYILRNC